MSAYMYENMVVPVKGAYTMIPKFLPTFCAPQTEAITLGLETMSWLDKFSKNTRTGP